MPEFSIFSVLEMFLNVIREDFADAATEQDSFLYKLFNEDEYTDTPLGIERYKFFEQAKKLLIENKGKEALVIRIGYSLEKLPPVCLHIMMPNDSPNLAEIGDGVGYVDSVVEEVIEVDEEENSTSTFFNRDFKSSQNSSNYNVLITSGNMIEVVLVYHWLKAMFLIFREQLEFRGLRNATFGGSDINFDESIVPPHLFHRNLNLSFIYDFSVPNYLKKFVANSIKTVPKVEPKS